MHLDIREILFNWLHRGEYYGYLEESESAIAAQRKGRPQNVPHYLIGHLWDGVAYEGTEERLLAWLEIDLALRNMEPEYIRQLSDYLTYHKTVPLNEWGPLRTTLWIEIRYALKDIIEEAYNDNGRG